MKYPIKPSKILYIKLGKGGRWEKECLKEKQIIRLSFNETNHNDCKNGDWKAVFEHYLEEGKRSGTANNFIKQLQLFYESDPNTLWITFHDNKLWWCFASSEIIYDLESYDEDNADKYKTKIKNVIGAWSDKDIQKTTTFTTDKISGKILKTKGFQGTICEIKEEEANYLINKIKGDLPEEVKKARTNITDLKNNLTHLIKHLYWKDFEILIDMLFRQSGYQRIGMLGGQEKDIDLDLFSPITNEKIAVQIKAQSNTTEFQEYCKTFENWEGYPRFFYVTQHLQNEKSKFLTDNPKIKVLFTEDIADLAMNYGLIEWIIDKNS